MNICLQGVHFKELYDVRKDPWQLYNLGRDLDCVQIKEVFLEAFVVKLKKTQNK